MSWQGRGNAVREAGMAAGGMCLFALLAQSGLPGTFLAACGLVAALRPGTVASE